jgi:hypothetical protein
MNRSTSPNRISTSAANPDRGSQRVTHGNGAAHPENGSYEKQQLQLEQDELEWKVDKVGKAVDHAENEWISIGPKIRIRHLCKQAVGDDLTCRLRMGESII